MADEQLSIDVTAKDSASKVIGGIQKSVDKLDKSDPEIDVTADTRKADHSVDALADQLDRLSADDRAVVVALRAGAAQAELSELAADLARIDATDPDVDVKFARYAEVSGQLDQLDAQLKELGTNGGANLQKVSDRVDGIGDSAGRAGGAVHSMAGNAVGDFAATATGIGPLGEAFGQLTEQAAGAESSIKQIAVAGAGMAGMAATMYVVQKAMKAIADEKAFHAEQVDAYTKSIKEAGTATADLEARLREAGKVMGSPGMTNASNFTGMSEAVRDVTATLLAAGLTVEQYAELVGGSAADIDRWVAAQEAAGTMSKATVTTMQLLVDAQKDVATANKAAEVSAEFFTDSQAAMNAEAARWQGQADEYARKTGAAARKMSDLADATDDETNAYKELSDQISGDQSMLDLADSLDDVREAGDDAYAAQAAANEAIRKNAKDATDKQREAEQAMRDYQSTVNAAKQDIINLGATANATPIEVKTALDKIDAGDLAGAKADAEAWSKRNPVVLSAELRVQLIKALGAGLGTVQVAGTSTAATTNVFLARPAAARETARLAGRHARINGR